jgi:acetyl-CoA acetyltransferase
MPKTDNPVAIVGCGYTDLSRVPRTEEVELGIQACRQAAEDAGIDSAEIDGINIQVHHWPPPDTDAIVRGLGAKQVRWREDGGFGVFSLASVASALDAKQCDVVAVCKIMNTDAPISAPALEGDAASGPWQFEVPYGLGYTMQRVGLIARRWMHRYGIRPEQVGWVPVIQREHALLNPHAYFKDPLTLDDYMSSRMISDPVRLHDCDYPVNGAFAYIASRGDRARALRRRPVYVNAWAESGFPYTELFAPYLLAEDVGGPMPMAQTLYSDAGLSPADMDLWMLYDGFSYLALMWMENLGLVPRGEAAAYAEGGERIRYTGEHPLNTHGGQLSEGRLHGAGTILEAVQQLRGEAGARQAARAEVAIVSSGFPNIGAAAILSR